MPKYVYHYFNIRGRGEIPRLIFAATGTEFTDKRYEFQEWPALKASMPLGALPILEVEGQKFPESVAISRFLARRLGLAGKSDLDQLQADAIVDIIISIRETLVKAHFEKDEAKKAEMSKKFQEEDVPKYFGYIEGLLAKNAAGFVAGPELTWADLALLDIGDMLKKHGILDKFSKIAAHRQKISALPKLAKYLKERPETDL